VIPLLVKAGSILAKLGCEADLPGLGKESLVAELTQFKKKEQSLQQELDIHHSAVAKLRSQKKESPRNQLETSRIQFREMEKQRTKVSNLYGKALYDKLEQNASPQQVGSVSMALMEQISLHLRRVDRLEDEILGLQNQMKVEELEAQIELENQKIRHLRTQIEQSNNQISQVELSIARKREKITSLRPRMVLPDHE
jgi:chromosome segregation ATPase